jgi:protein-L-isoaspartate(D-aspartate) O-methyltransferase
MLSALVRAYNGTLDKVVQAALKAVPREAFLPDFVAEAGGLNVPLPIGFGQTNSQPHTVQLMLEWLEVEKGQKVLDVGSGSGWTSALLSHLVGSKGKVVAVEIVPELVEFGRSNCQRLGSKNITFYLAGEAFGWSKRAPYDRILVSAYARELPHDLTEQLAPGGRMVIPVKNSILVVNKDKNGNIDTQDHPGFSFVPLV